MDGHIAQKRNDTILMILAIHLLWAYGKINGQEREITLEILYNMVNICRHNSSMELCKKYIVQETIHTALCANAKLNFM
jgi:hypothetical protein